MKPELGSHLAVHANRKTTNAHGKIPRNTFRAVTSWFVWLSWPVSAHRHDDRAAKEREISTGRREGDRVEVVRGLEAGETVISNADQGHAGRVAVSTEKAPLTGNLGGE